MATTVLAHLLHKGTKCPRAIIELSAPALHTYLIIGTKDMENVGDALGRTELGSCPTGLC